MGLAAGTTPATSAAPLNSERRDTSRSGTRAVVSSQQPMQVSKLSAARSAFRRRALVPRAPATPPWLRSRFFRTPKLCRGRNPRARRGSELRRGLIAAQTPAPSPDAAFARRYAHHVGRAGPGGRLTRQVQRGSAIPGWERGEPPRAVSAGSKPWASLLSPNAQAVLELKPRPRWLPGSPRAESPVEARTLPARAPLMLPRPALRRVPGAAVSDPRWSRPRPAAFRRDAMQFSAQLRAAAARTSATSGTSRQRQAPRTPPTRV